MKDEYKKLPNGWGSITLLQGKRRNKYWVRGPAYRDNKGKIKRISLGTYETYYDAYETLRNDNLSNNIDNYTIYDFYKLFKEGKKYKRLSEQTQKEYDRNILKFEPLINYSIKKVSFNALQNKVDELIEEGYEVNGKHKDYSPSTLTKISSALSAAYIQAINNGVLNDNITARLDFTAARDPDSYEPFDLDFISSLFASNELDVWRLLINCYTGLRPGEMIKLKKSNINIEAGYIENIGIKTDAGKIRKIPIIKDIRPFVMYFLKCGKSDYILGKRYTTKTYRDNFFYPLLEKLGYKGKVSPYSCRHTFADILNRKNIDKEVIKQVMGHVSYSTTSDNYISEDIKKSIDEFNTKF